MFQKSYGCMCIINLRSHHYIFEQEKQLNSFYFYFTAFKTAFFEKQYPVRFEIDTFNILRGTYNM